MINSLIVGGPLKLIEPEMKKAMTLGLGFVNFGIRDNPTEVEGNSKTAEERP